MRFLRTERLLAVLMFGAFFGCGTESDTGSGAGPDNGSGGTQVGSGGTQAGSGGTQVGSGGTQAGSGGTGAGPNASTLAGTWEVIESGATGPLGSVTVGKDELVIALDGGTLSYRAVNGVLSVSWQGAAFTPVTSSRQPGVLDTGALALDLGGTWSFAASDGSGEGCSAEVEPGSFSASCEGVTPPRPVPPANGTVTGTRTEARSSIFGELGGLWAVTTENGACTAELVDNKFSSTCAGEPGGSEHGIDGSVEIVFDGDLASGHASDGIEFSAHRIQ